MENKLITIIVTVYNTAEYLDKFFENVSRQTFGGYELLMIDDGSEDNSLEICRRYAEKDPRIRVIHTKHIGISAARNLAFGELMTEFATSLDTDDPFEPDYLKHLIDAQRKYDADLVISNVIFQEENGFRYMKFPPRAEALYRDKEIIEVLPELLREDRLNYLYGKIFRTEYLKDVRVEPDVLMGSDTMIVFQYLMSCGSLAVIEDYDYYHVRYPSRSVTSVKGLNKALRLYRLNTYLYDISERNGWMSDKLCKSLDERNISIGVLSVKGLPLDKDSFPESCRTAEEIISNETYLTAYRRLEEKDALEGLRQKPIEPGKAVEYMEKLREDQKNRKKRERKRKIRAHIPDSMLNAFSRIKQTVKGK